MNLLKILWKQIPKKAAKDDLKQTDGKKTNKPIIPKLDDANWAGQLQIRSMHSNFTDGDSASPWRSLVYLKLVVINMVYFH